MESASKWNHLAVAGSIPTTGNNKEYLQYLNTCTESWLIELEQSTLVQIKGLVEDCVNWVYHETPGEGQRIYRPKHCKYNIKVEVNSPNILNNNDYQASSEKFWQIIWVTSRRD